ncbi:MAG TPA: hypothetical protein VKY40_07970 [Halanaerobiales bacterium]|nr:hypothetical protein [Halanaerobiales bacterium]
MQTELSYQDQGPFRVKITGLKQNGRIRINFKETDNNDYYYLRNHILLQYRFVCAEKESKWSEWVLLKDLPLEFRLLELIEEEIDNQQAVLFLKFRVPQSIYLRSGEYRGEFNIEIIE